MALVVAFRQVSSAGDPLPARGPRTGTVRELAAGDGCATRHRQAIGIDIESVLRAHDVAGAPAVAFVHDNEVKKVPWEFLVKAAMALPPSAG